MSKPKAALHTACMALTSTINSALESASLDPLTGDIEESPVSPATGRPVPPRLSFTFIGNRAWVKRTAESELEEVPVTWYLETDGKESTAVAYEDVVVQTLEGILTTLQAAMPAGVKLHDWRLTEGSSSLSEERTNRDGFETRIGFIAEMEW